MKRRLRGGSTETAVIGSLVVLALLILSLLGLSGYFTSKVDRRQELVVYCASGVMPAVSKIAEQYEAELGVRVRLQPGSSGVLEQQLQQTRFGDLYIPASVEPFLTRGRDQRYVDEIIPLAGLRLVLAVQPGNPKSIHTLDDLLRNDVNVVVAAPPAAVGKVTRDVLRDWTGFSALENKATNKPTVTEVANDVQIGVRADAGLIWDATARQVKLEIVDVDYILKHPAATSTIGAGVLSFTTQPAAALRFARFLSAPEKGQVQFIEQHYSPVSGDAWSVTPQLTLYSGGLNRVAIEETLAEFQKREGCEIVSTYQGCGTLVTMMKAGQMPDAYLACDVSFVTDVADEFSTPITISETDMVMLVQPGNPKGVRELADLGGEGVRVGIADENLTALGRLTVQLLDQAGVYETVIANRVSSAPTADLLVSQLTTVGSLDAVIVYRANCNHVGDAGQIVPIHHPAAKAFQPLAIQRKTKYPQLTARLMRAIVSEPSRKRFESSGFHWQYTDSNQPVEAPIAGAE